MCIGMANGGKTPKELTDKEIVKEKIKAIYPHIVVGGDIDKPCYSIHWYDIEQKKMICGFASYKLEFVHKWLEEEFEVVERDIDDLLDRQQAEIENLEYKLLGVMHFVDKWLNGAELEQDEINRAVVMREKTLQIVEKQQAEIERLQKAYKQCAWERDTAIEQLKSYGVGFCENADVVKVVRCKDCKYYDVYRLECHNPYHNGIINCEGYCNYGERKCDNG